MTNLRDIPKQTVWVFALLVTLGSSIWYTSNKTPVQFNEQSLNSIPDVIIHELTLQQFDNQGKLSHFLQTPFLHHIPFNDTHYIQTPHVIVIQPDQPSWEIHAQTATSIHAGKQITFKHNVIIQQNDQYQKPEKTLETEEITYFPAKKLATTRRQIIFKQDQNYVESVGMQAYLGENRVKLLSHARGIYEVKQQG